MMARKSALPPYASAIIAAQRRRQPVNLWLYAGRGAWDSARSKPHAVVVSEDWMRRDWRWIAGLDATLVARDWSPDDVIPLGRHLIRNGARLIVALAVTETATGTTLHPLHFRRRTRSHLWRPEHERNGD